jgi:hypothetical protein
MARSADGSVMPPTFANLHGAAVTELPRPGANLDASAERWQRDTAKPLQLHQLTAHGTPSVHGMSIDE